MDGVIAFLAIIAFCSTVSTILLSSIHCELKEINQHFRDRNEQTEKSRHNKD